MDRTRSAIDRLPQLADEVDDGAWAADLVAASAELLDRGLDVLQDGAGGLVVLGHGPVRALAQHPDVGNAPLDYLLGRSAERLRRTSAVEVTGPAGAFESFLRNQVFTMNPPLHPDVRRLVARHLMPRAVAGMRPAAERLAAEVVDAVLDRGEVDLGRDVAGRFATRFWTDQLGMPVEDAERVQQLMHDMNRMFLFAPTAEDREALLQATEEYTDLVGRRVRAARGTGSSGLVDQVAADLAAADAPGGPDDLGALLAANFFDGFHTVGVAAANAAHLLLSHPDALAQVRADPSLAAAAFSEGTRLAAPLMLTTRMALAPVDLDGLPVPAGTPLTLVWISANRDPRSIDQPSAHRLDRGRAPLTTFGGGARICPGRTAAAMLGEVLLQQLCRPDVEVEPAGAGPVWVGGSAIRQLGAHPVSLRRATGR